MILYYIVNESKVLQYNAKLYYAWQCVFYTINRNDWEKK